MDKVAALRACCAMSFRRIGDRKELITMKPWPSRDERQQIELVTLIKGYRTLGWGGEIELVKWRERPDCEVRDVKTGQVFGLELTSVFLDDKRVESFRRDGIKIPYPTSGLLDIYQARLIQKVREKVEKARSGYEIYSRMMLSIYVADVIAIHLKFIEDWHNFHEYYRSDFENIQPFSEVVFCNLANGEIFATKYVE
jgi:hypothetical protein